MNTANGIQAISIYKAPKTKKVGTFDNNTLINDIKSYTEATNMNRKCIFNELI